MNPPKREFREWAEDFFFDHIRLISGMATTLIVLAYPIYLVIGFISQPFGPADIFQSKTAITVAEAQERTGLPIPISARNIRLATFSQFVAYECFLRFEAPVADCEAFAERVIAQNGGPKPAGQAAPLKAIDFPIDPSIAKCAELETDWFDVTSIRGGKQCGHGASHAPKVWIDTKRGVVYFRLHD